MSCIQCTTCSCVVCNCRAVKLEIDAGCYVESIQLDSRSANRSQLKNNILQGLVHFPWLKCVLISSIDTQKGKTVILDFVFYNKPSSAQWKEMIDILSREYSNVKIYHNKIIQDSLTRTTHCELQLKGLKCKKCVDKINDALSRIKGLKSSSVDLRTEIVSVDYCTDLTTISIIAKKIRLLGYEITNSNLDSLAKLNYETGQNMKDCWETVSFEILGMTCSSCVTSVEEVLKRLPGVENTSVIVTLIPPRIVLNFDRFKTDVDKIEKCIEKLGFKVSSVYLKPLDNFYLQSSTQQIIISIKGMTCASCVNGLESFLSRQSGIEKVEITLLTEKGTVEYNSSLIGPRDIISLINEIGYTAEIAGQEDETIDKESVEISDRKFKVLQSLFFVAPAFFQMLVMLLPRDNPVFQFFMLDVVAGVSVEDLMIIFLTIPMQFWFGWSFYVGSYKSLVYLKTANMDVLISLGTTIVFLYSFYAILKNYIMGYHSTPQFFETSIFIIFFVMLGKYIEAIAKGGTSDAIKNLVALKPRVATVVEFRIDMSIEKETIIDLRLLHVGDVVKVTPGSRFPCDGFILSGSSYVDESMLTGESLPIFKKDGDSVLGGTLNNSSMLLVKIDKLGEDTMLSRIIRLVEDAQSKRAPIQAFADKISAIFVPVVLAISLMTFIIWQIVFAFGLIDVDNPMLFSIEHAIAVLVIACPCALGLATPTAVMVGTGVAASNGVLVSGGGAALEKSSFIKIMAFDKTGTLTVGAPKVQNVLLFPCDDLSENDIWSLILQVESTSSHPLAKSILNFAHDDSVAFSKKITVTNVVESAGKGISAEFLLSQKKVQVFIGSEKWMSENKIDIPDKRQLNRWKNDGKSIVLCGVSGDSTSSLLCMIGISDQVRPEASYVVQCLKSMGIDVWMITGDNLTTANFIASEVGIKPENICSQVLPDQKGAQIERLKLICSNKWKKGTVAMVGDGINDSVALAKADIGIAIGAGSDIAIEAAQAVLVRSDLIDILTLYEISSQTYRRIRSNFAWALIFNLIGIPFAAGILYPSLHVSLAPWMAALAMAFSSVAVVLSSLFLRFYYCEHKSLIGERTVVDINEEEEPLLTPDSNQMSVHEFENAD